MRMTKPTCHDLRATDVADHNVHLQGGAFPCLTWRFGTLDFYASPKHAGELAEAFRSLADGLAAIAAEIDAPRVEVIQ